MPDKLGGVILMGAAIVVLFFLPWLDRCDVKSIRYRTNPYKIALAVFAVSFLVLGYLGLQPATGIYPLLAQIFSAFYFGFFIFLFIYTGQVRGWNLGNSLAMLAAIASIVVIFSKRMLADDSNPEVTNAEDYYRWFSWVFALGFLGYFAFLVAVAGREVGKPVPDRLTYHG